MGLLYEDLTYLIQGCIFDVHNELGAGYDEETYHLAIEKRLEEANIPFQSKVGKYVVHRDNKVHKFIADIVVDNKVILELKCIEKSFSAAHYHQILSYLKCWKLKIGFLINLGLPKVYSKRIILRPITPELVEDYTFIQELITPTNRLILRQLRKSVLDLLELHGTGYDASIYKEIFITELTYQKLDFILTTKIPVNYKSQIIRQFKLKELIIQNQILCKIVALKESINSDIIKMKTHLRALKLPIGLLIHFGKDKFEIHGINPKK